jgi:type IV secretion system protein VirB9
MLNKIILALLLISSNTFAEQIPTPSKKDFRIKFVNYDKYDVVKIHVAQGYAAQIVFSEEEILNSNNVMYGAKEGWEKSISNNILYLKPKLTFVENSNILIKTNKRTYNISATVCQKECGKNLTYTLIYNYGNSNDNKDQVEQEQKTAKSIIKNFKTSYKNYQYTAQGNQELKPIDAWDNGQFTYLKFASHKNIPSVYLIQDDKTESLTNSHIENKNTIVIHQLAKTFILRAGKQVLAVHNENYGNTITNNSNTASIFVERVNKDD